MFTHNYKSTLSTSGLITYEIITIYIFSGSTFNEISSNCLSMNPLKKICSGKIRIDLVLKLDLKKVKWHTIFGEFPNSIFECVCSYEMLINFRLFIFGLFFS